jgi:predicted PP-loop superfamily ATPase
VAFARRGSLAVPANPRKLGVQKDLEAIVAELAPQEARLAFGEMWRPKLVVPVSAGLDGDTAARLQRAIVARLEPLAPELPPTMRRTPRSEAAQ